MILFYIVFDGYWYYLLKAEEGVQERYTFSKECCGFEQHQHYQIKSNQIIYGNIKGFVN